MRKYDFGLLGQKYERIIFFDTETTGLSARTNTIINLCMDEYVKDGGLFVAQRSIDDLIRLPYGEKVPPFIVNLTGITDATLASSGLSPFEVAEKAEKLLMGKESTLIVAYNAAFDIEFLYFFAMRYLEKDIINLLNTDFLDCLSAYKDRAQYPHKLKDAIEHYNLSDIVANSHRASDDVDSMIEVFAKIIEEKDDLLFYVNLFGYNPKYRPSICHAKKIRFLPQYFNSNKALYE